MSGPGVGPQTIPQLAPEPEKRRQRGGGRAKERRRRGGNREKKKREKRGEERRREDKRGGEEKRGEQGRPPSPFALLQLLPAPRGIKVLL